MDVEEEKMLEVGNGGADVRFTALFAATFIFRKEIPYKRANCLGQTGLQKTTIAKDLSSII